MNSYYKSSEYYPDDKDIYDFLQTADAALPAMTGFLADYGIICSPANTKNDIQDYVSFLYFSWPRATQLLELVDVRDSVEHTTLRELPSLVVKNSTVAAAVDSIKTLRSEREREVYDIRTNGSETEVTITYVDVNPSRTRILQKRQKDLTITIDNNTTNVTVRHTNNPRAHKIVEGILGKIAEIEAKKTEEFNAKFISFAGIPTVKLRVNFFKDMMGGLHGFSLKNVVHLKVDRLKSPTTALTLEDDEDDDEDVVQANDAVSKVIIYGNQLFETAEFQDLVTKGFYISTATWKSEKADAANDLVEFSAGFADADKCEIFNYKVLGKYSSVDGEISKTRETLPPASAKAYGKCLEEGARSAFHKIAEAAQQEAKK